MLGLVSSACPLYATNQELASEMDARPNSVDRAPHNRLQALDGCDLIRQRLVASPLARERDVYWPRQPNLLQCSSVSKTQSTRQKQQQQKRATIRHSACIELTSIGRVSQPSYSVY